MFVSPQALLSAKNGGLAVGSTEGMQHVLPLCFVFYVLDCLKFQDS